MAEVEDQGAALVQVGQAEGEGHGGGQGPQQEAGIGEGDTAIYHQPTAVVAVEIEIHADLAASAQRKEPEIPLAGRHGLSSRRLPIGIAFQLAGLVGHVAPDDLDLSGAHPRLEADHASRLQGTIVDDRAPGVG